MSVHRSISLSTGINSDKGIYSNFWVLLISSDERNTEIASRVTLAKMMK